MDTKDVIQHFYDGLARKDSSWQDNLAESVAFADELDDVVLPDVGTCRVGHGDEKVRGREWPLAQNILPRP